MTKQLAAIVVVLCSVIDGCGSAPVRPEPSPPIVAIPASPAQPSTIAPPGPTATTPPPTSVSSTPTVPVPGVPTLSPSPTATLPSPARAVANLTPGPGAMTVFRIGNPASITASGDLTFSSTAEPSATVLSLPFHLGAGQSQTYHVRDLTPIPQSFVGTLRIRANHTVTAQIVGYDYPVPVRSPSRSPGRDGG